MRVARKGHIVTGGLQNARHAVWDILIELHRRHDQAVTGTMLSRANSAAYAKAAAIASVGNDG